MEENPEDGVSNPSKIQNLSENQEKGKKCEICMKEVKMEIGLKRHKTLIHGSTSEKHFKCQKCNKSCPSFESLIEHHISSVKSDEITLSTEEIMDELMISLLKVVTISLSIVAYVMKDPNLI